MLEGVLPVLPTPFDASGQIDEAGMARVTEFALEAGADGVVFPGVASEFDHLSAAERETLVQGLRHEGRAPAARRLGLALPRRAQALAFAHLGQRGVGVLGDRIGGQRHMCSRFIPILHHRPAQSG